MIQNVNNNQNPSMINEFFNKTKSIGWSFISSIVPFIASQEASEVSQTAEKARLSGLKAIKKTLTDSNLKVVKEGGKRKLKRVSVAPIKQRSLKKITTKKNLTKQIANVKDKKAKAHLQKNLNYAGELDKASFSVGLVSPVAGAVIGGVSSVKKVYHLAEYAGKTSNIIHTTKKIVDSFLIPQMISGATSFLGNLFVSEKTIEGGTVAAFKVIEDLSSTTLTSAMTNTVTTIGQNTIEGNAGDFVNSGLNELTSNETTEDRLNQNIISIAKHTIVDSYE